MDGSRSWLLKKSFATVCIYVLSCMSCLHAYCCWLWCSMYLLVCMCLCIHCHSLMLHLRYSSKSSHIDVIDAFTYKWFYVLVWFLLYSFHMSYIRSFRVTVSSTMNTSASKIELSINKITTTWPVETPNPFKTMLHFIISPICFENDYKTPL